ncbi:MAG TPA: tRNA (guanine(10)-N(2))-dimethyltransferase [Candidatus Bathyarchaeia archaeon]|nr:tRNA (guanine(10)-N(2))-dimethyltransferase [Candidatus Bathyarchaeia archaeon]
MSQASFEAGFPTETVEEGSVKIIVPRLRAFVKSPSEYAPSKAPVFYNPVMELNRDIAVLALQAYQRAVNREITVCEPLAGCGAMGVRFAAEVKGVKNVVMADISEKAAQLAVHNVHINNLDEKVKVKNQDANLLLNHHGAPHKRFDVVNIDPFGSPVPYLDSAVRALRNKGLLAVTATDMAPLCGVHSKACIRKYGGKPLRTEYCHELAVRLLAGCLAVTAAKYEIGMDVVFSHRSNHYVRVYAILQHGAKKADRSIKEMGYILHCFNCLHREASKTIFSAEKPWKCSECKANLNYAGPLWLGPIVDERFCGFMKEAADQTIFKNGEKIAKILALITEESDAPPTYYVVDELSDVLNLPVPPVKLVVDSLRKEGFEACLTHFNTRGIKSDVSAMKIRDVLKKIASRNW